MMKEVLDELRAQQRALILDAADAQTRVGRITDLIARIMAARDDAERKVLGIKTADVSDA